MHKLKNIEDEFEMGEDEVVLASSKNMPPLNKD